MCKQEAQNLWIYQGSRTNLGPKIEYMDLANKVRHNITTH